MKYQIHVSANLQIEVVVLPRQKHKIKVHKYLLILDFLFWNVLNL